MARLEDYQVWKLWSLPVSQWALMLMTPQESVMSMFQKGKL